MTPATAGAGSPGTGEPGGLAQNKSLPAYNALQHPCALVTKSEAETILRVQLQDPQEQPLGPTCVYKTTDSSNFVTVAKEQVNFDKIQPMVQNLTKVDGLGHKAYCGTYGHPQMYVLLTIDSVLNIGAPCNVAQQFAAKAVPRLQP
jgi:hypothetical protein